MTDVLSAYEPHLRLLAFTGVFWVMAAWAVISPRRHHDIGRLRRWPSNLAIVALDTLFVRLLFPTTAVGAAMLAEARGWGLMNGLINPPWLAIVIGVSSSISPSICSTCCSTPCRRCGDYTACTTQTLSST
jgi:hypothetical protein